MFAHLLVPLDGSRLAEAVLPLCAALAGRDCAVTLLHIIEPDAPPSVHGEPHLRGVSAAAAYLDAIRARAFPPDVLVHRHVHSETREKVPRGIADHAGELGADVVILCTHGRSNLRHRIFGSVAERVVKIGVAPVMLVSPEAPAPMPPFGRLLVPLDGEPAHESALSTAAGMARENGAEVHLLMVVPTPGTLPAERAAPAHLMPGTAAALLDLEHDRAVEYLEQCAARLERSGVRAFTHVVRGDIAAAINTAVTDLAVDLIVVGSHGTAGLDAFWEGAITPRVSAHATVPVLLVPAAAAVS